MTRKLTDEIPDYLLRLQGGGGKVGSPGLFSTMPKQRAIFERMTAVRLEQVRTRWEKREANPPSREELERLLRRAEENEAHLASASEAWSNAYEWAAHPAEMQRIEDDAAEYMRTRAEREQS